MIVRVMDYLSHCIMPSLFTSLSLSSSLPFFLFPSTEEENKMAWVYAENAEDDDFVIDSSGQLPLFVEHYHLTNNSKSFSVRSCRENCIVYL